jgi:hypothetical protein
MTRRRICAGQCKKDALARMRRMSITSFTIGEQTMSRYAKRHYVQIAEILSGNRDFVDAFCDLFARDNENFSEDRFRAACQNGINAPGVGAAIRGGPAMPYYQGGERQDRVAKRRLR